MLTALSSIASTQAEPTKETMENIKLFLDYAASHQDAILTYQASDMVLIVHSNSSYLSKPKARSHARGHFFMSSNVTNPHNNGAVLNIAQLIKAVMTPHRNGPHPTAYSHSNQKQHGMRGSQQQYTTLANKSNGHEITLVTLP
jgi:hypothetical protein